MTEEGSGTKKRKLDEDQVNGTEDYNHNIDEQPFNANKEEIRRLLAPFTYEQLTEILLSAACQHESVYNEIRAVASSDVAHRKIFVRGLAWETKSESLLKVFSVYGEIEEGAVIADKVTGKSRGYGFVTFKDMESAQRALESPKKKIDGRETQSNLAAVRPAERPQTGGQMHYPSHQGPGDISERKLFVRGLSWDTTNETLGKAFEEHGLIEEACVARDRQSGKSKGFGFVTYAHASSAHRALQQGQKVIDGRTTYCNLASQNPSRLHDKNMMAQNAGMTPVVATVVGGMPAYTVAVPSQQVGMYSGMPPNYIQAPNPQAQSRQHQGQAQLQTQSQAQARSYAYAQPSYSAHQMYPTQQQYISQSYPQQTAMHHHSRQHPNQATGSAYGQGVRNYVSR